MVEFGEVVYYVLLACCFCTIPLSFLHQSMRKHCEAAVGILLMLALLTPIADALIDLGKGEILPPRGEEYSDEEYTRGVKNAFEKGIEDAVIAEFGLNSKDVTVSVVGLRVPELTVDEVRVVLSGGGLLADREEIRKMIEEGISFTNAEGRCAVEYCI